MTIDRQSPVWSWRDNVTEKLGVIEEHGQRIATVEKDIRSNNGLVRVGFTNLMTEMVAVRLEMKQLDRGAEIKEHAKVIQKHDRVLFQWSWLIGVVYLATIGMLTQWPKIKMFFMDVVK